MDHESESNLIFSVNPMHQFFFRVHSYFPVKISVLLENLIPSTTP